MRPYLEDWDELEFIHFVGNEKRFVEAVEADFIAWPTRLRTGGGWESCPRLAANAATASIHIKDKRKGSRGKAEWAIWEEVIRVVTKVETRNLRLGGAHVRGKIA